MNKNTRLLYCILGSVILSLMSIPTFYNLIDYIGINYIPIVGIYFSELLYIISTVGIILTIYFSIVLIKENWTLSR